MIPSTRTPILERKGNVAVFTFTATTNDAENRIAGELDGQIDDLADCHLLLDFTHVDSLRTVDLSTLVDLRRKMKTVGGELTLFNLKHSVYELFTITWLHTLLNIHTDGLPPQLV